MVEYTLDTIFSSLADPIRRDILERVSEDELSVSEIALPYDISLAAVSKHLKLLQKARLIIKRRSGKQQLVRADAAAFKEAAEYLEQYIQRWESRLNQLDDYLQEMED